MRNFGVDKLVVPGQNIGLSNLLGLLRDRFSKEYKGKLSVVILTSEGRPASILKSCTAQNYTIESSEQDEFTALHLTRLIRDIDTDEEKRLEGTFYLVSIGADVWGAVTIEPDDFIEGAMLRMFELCSPDISRMRYSSSEMRRLLEKFAETHEFSAQVHKAITYPFGGSASIDFDNKPMQQLFDWCETERRYLDKARLEFFSQGRSFSDVFVSRQGLFRFYSGDIDFFFRKFVDAFAGGAEETKELLQKRDRKLGELTANPLAIDFEEDVFVSAEDNGRFIGSLSQLEKSGISVYHQNPYIHLSFLDFRDGSSCDVFAVSPRSICVVPSFRASVESLMRLTNRIIESLGEGSVVESKERAPKFNDFIA